MRHNDWPNLIEGLIYLGIGAVSLTTYILERKEGRIPSKVKDEKKNHINVFEEPSTIDFPR